MASQNILLPVQPEVTFKVISRSNIDIILKNQHFGRRIERAGPMTFKVTLKVTGVNYRPTFQNFCLYTQIVKITKNVFYILYCPIKSGLDLLRPNMHIDAFLT